MADLSLESAPESQRESDDARLRMVNQQISQKKWVFWIGVIASSLLVIFFMCFAWRVVNIIQAGQGAEVTWPMVAIGSVTLLSGVTILISLARFAYDSKPNKKSDDPQLELPHIEAVQKILEIAKEIYPKA